MAGELIDFGNRMASIVDPSTMRRVVMAGGLAGKDAALDTAASDLGGDRSFSGLRRRVPLGAGFDDVGNTQIRLNFRPAGLWKLAESGRRAGKVIRPRKARALATPHGPRASAWNDGKGAWGGKGTFTTAVRKARTEVPREAFKQFQREVARVVK